MIFVARRAPTASASSADLLRRSLCASLSSSSSSSSAAHAGTRSRRPLSSSSSSADDNETDDDVRRSSSSSSSSRTNANRSSGDPLDYLRTWVGGGGGSRGRGGGGTPSPSSSSGGGTGGRLSRRPAPPTSSHPTSSSPSPSLSSTSSLPPHMRKAAATSPPSFLSPSPASSDNHQVSHRSLVVTGGTYLIPTLRLERSDTPSSLSAGIERALGGVGGGAVRSLLGLRGGGPGGADVGGKRGSKKRAWRVPIVLDLSALAPDGSPHYRPPPPGLLSSLVEVLDEYGMRAVGASNLTKGGGGGGGGTQTQTEPRTALELESARLGLPRVMTMARSGGGGGGAPPPAFGIEEVVGMVLARAEEETDDDIIANDDSAAVSEMESVVETGEGIVEEDETMDDEEEDEDSSEFSTADVLDVSLPLPSAEEVDNMTFASLKRECRSRGLLSTGNTEALRQRLRKHLSLLEYIAREEEEEDAHRETQVPGPDSAVVSSLEKGDDDGDGSPADELAAPVAPPPPLPSGATVYRGTVRSGQQVSSDPGSSSLIVIGNVSSGGEVLSDGDIYVLGKLRGRALAGLGLASPKQQREQQGEREGGADGTATTARIFATSFDPELVCVGDEFTTVDDVEELGLEREGAAMVSLETTTTMEDEGRGGNSSGGGGSSGRLRFEKVAL